MRLGWVVLCSIAGVSGVVGCGGSNSSEEGDDTQAVEPLNPPPNIDAEICWDRVAMDGESAACLPCCTDGGFSGSTLYENHCVCGNPLDDGADTVCAAYTASDGECSSCCTDEGFNGHGWVGDPTPSCRCFGRTDRAVCASALQTADPSAECRVCCLNHGYLGSGYDGITPECLCISP